MSECPHSKPDERESDVPTRVSVALVTLQTLRPAAAIAHGEGPETGTPEAACVSAACRVLMLYLLGENDYGDDGKGHGKAPRPPDGPATVPAEVPG